MEANTFYSLALPFIIFGSISSMWNAYIQTVWFKDYKKDKHEKL